MDRKLLQSNLSDESVQILLCNEKNNWQKFIACAYLGKRECQAFLQKPWKRHMLFMDMYSEFHHQNHQQNENEDDDGDDENGEDNDAQNQDTENDEDENGEDHDFQNQDTEDDDGQDENEEAAQHNHSNALQRMFEQKQQFERTVLTEPFWGDFPANSWFTNHPYISGVQPAHVRKDGQVQTVKRLSMQRMALNPNMLVSLQRLDYYFKYTELRTCMNSKKWDKMEALCLKPRCTLVVPARLFTYAEELERRNLRERELSPEEWKICLNNRDKNVHFLHFFTEAFSDHMMHRHALAWAMANHSKRLGSASPARDLSNEISRVIWKYVVESRRNDTHSE